MSKTNETYIKIRKFLKENFRLNHTILLLSLILYSVFAFLTIEHEAIYLDEGLSLYLASLPSDIFESTKASTLFPLYHMLLFLWIQIFGSKDDFLLRSVGLLTGIGTIVITYYLSQFFFKNKVDSSLAALLLSFSPLFIRFTQEVRFYCLFGFLSTLTVLLLLKFIETEKRKWGILFIIIATLGLYTLILQAYVLIGLGLVLLIAARHKAKLLIHGILSYSLIFIFYFPWLWIKREVFRFRTQRSGLEFFSILQRSLRDISGWVGNIHLSSPNIYLFEIILSIIFIPIFVCASVIILLKFRNERDLTKFSILFILVPIYMSPSIISVITTSANLRVQYYMASAPLFSIWIIQCFNALKTYSSSIRIRNKISIDFSIALIIIIVLLQLSGTFRFTLNHDFYDQDFKGVCTYLNSNYKEGHSILLFGFTTNIMHYLEDEPQNEVFRTTKRLYSGYTDPPTIGWDFNKIFKIIPGTFLANTTFGNVPLNVLKQYIGVYVITYQSTEIPHDWAAEWLKKNAVLQEIDQFESMYIMTFIVKSN